MIEGLDWVVKQVLKHQDDLDSRLRQWVLEQREQMMSDIQAAIDDGVRRMTEAFAPIEEKLLQPPVNLDAFNALVARVETTAAQLASEPPVEA